MENQTLTPIIFYSSDEASLTTHLETNYPASKFIYLKIEAQPNSIKLEQVNQLKSQLAITFNQPRLVWLKQAHLATLPAQNALLKILEEPPQKTLFVLTTTNLNQLLTTIQSRCQLQYLPSSTQTLNQDLLNQLKKILKQDLGERLAQLKQLPHNRAEALTWLDEIITSLNLARLQTQDLHKLKIFTQILQPTLEAKKHLQANLNLDLTLEHFLLSLPKTTN